MDHRVVGHADPTLEHTSQGTGEVVSLESVSTEIRGRDHPAVTYDTREPHQDAIKLAERLHKRREFGDESLGGQIGWRLDAHALGQHLALAIDDGRFQAATADVNGQESLRPAPARLYRGRATAGTSVLQTRESRFYGLARQATIASGKTFIPTGPAAGRIAPLSGRFRGPLGHYREQPVHRSAKEGFYVIRTNLDQ